MPFEVRRAKLDDIPKLIEIENHCFPTDRITAQQMRYLISKAKAVIYLAYQEKSKEIGGYGICFTPSKRTTARLYSLAVHPQFQGQGIASLILNKLLSKLKSLDYHFCNLEVRQSDEKTQTLYRRFGFTPIEQIAEYYADGEGATRMRTPL